MDNQGTTRPEVAGQADTYENKLEKLTSNDSIIKLLDPSYCSMEGERNDY